MIYEFECCGEVKEINVPVSEYYIPTCSECGKDMKRVYAPIKTIGQSFNGG